jgi:heme-degrading monooxygenase HmoA
MLAPLNLLVRRRATRRAKLENIMISRQWRGLARPSEAQNYAEHLRTETFPGLRELPGFISASILSRPIEDAIEFLIVTQWRSLDDIARFSGTDLEAAVVPAEVARMMVDYDRRVKHYEVVG